MHGSVHGWCMAWCMGVWVHSGGGVGMMWWGGGVLEIKAESMKS